MTVASDGVYATREKSKVFEGSTLLHVSRVLGARYRADFCIGPTTGFIFMLKTFLSFKTYR